MPSLKSAVVYATLATVFLITGSDYGPRIPLWARFICVALGLIFSAATIVESVNFLAYVMTLRAEEIRKLATITPVMEALRIMGKMSPAAQVELAMHFNALGVEYRAWVGETGPQFVFQTGGHTIPYHFIHEFFALASDRYLPAVRQWGEGTNEHRWADALTAYIVQRHYAIPAKGNKPAAWVFEGGRDCEPPRPRGPLLFREYPGIRF